MTRTHPNDIPRDIPTVTPKCVGIILDGNRRWARRHGRILSKGHTRGYKKMRDVIQWSREEGIRHLIVYAFSTENQKRSQPEVDALMDLFRDFFKRMADTAPKNNVRISFIGLREKLPEDVRVGIERLEKSTRHCTGLMLSVAAPYGSRSELIDAFERIRKSVPTDQPITEEVIASHLWTADVPDPDLIIRTGGRKRLSNFLLWQAAYSELFFTDTLWPDFSRRQFTKILYEYSLRERTYGK